MKRYLLWILISMTMKTYAQTQRISGRVTDEISKVPLGGVEVRVSGSGMYTITDSLGKFNLDAVPLGRRSVVFTRSDYTRFASEELIISAGREITLDVVLKRNAILLKEVVISSSGSPSDPVNTLAYVSARSFSEEDTEQIPASVNDPARMALSFMGVQGGRKDSDNELVIRGNSPVGILWRVEGVDIPSPNHFTKHGASAGGLTIFSSSLVKRSDFFTGGMPAEYGNALSGAFDIHFREGNFEKRQYKTKASFLGIDLSAEGPIRKGQSSYVINYRYSTLGILNKMKIFIGDERTYTTFQDLSFNIAFRSKDGRKQTNFYGAGGMSSENNFPLEPPAERNVYIWDDWEDKWRISDVGITGVNHRRTINRNSSLKAGMAVVASNIRITSDSLSMTNEKFRYGNEKYTDKRLVGSVHYQNQPGKSTFLKVGVMGNFLKFNFLKEYQPRIPYLDQQAFSENRQIIADGYGNTSYTQLYGQVVRNLGRRWTTNMGFHFLYFALNKQTSFEPRLSAKYQIKPGASLSMAYGWYSQILPMSTYFIVQKNQDGTFGYPNRHVEFPRSRHLILSYKTTTSAGWKIVSEAYLQKTDKVLVLPYTDSNFWFLNFPDGYPELVLEAKGSGKNYGLDLAIEKFFSKKYYLLFNASVFNSTYKTLDAKAYIASFNDRYGSSLTFGREFSLKNKAVLQVGSRAIFNGGLRYSPADIDQTMKYRIYVPVISETNTLSAPAYFRADGRVSYRVNGLKTTSVFSLDVQNLTNRQNFSKAAFNFETREVVLQRGAGGIVPVFSYQLNF